MNTIVTLGHLVHWPKQEVLSKYDIFTVGETSMVTTEHAIAITHHETGPLSMLFQFEHMDLDTDRSSTAAKWHLKGWMLRDLTAVMTRWQKDLENKGWNSFYLSNHDVPRLVSRFGDDGQYRIQSAKLLDTFLHLLHGTPYVYQGEEIGMTNVRFESITDYHDIDTHNIYHEFVKHRGMPSQDVMAMIHARSRDNARTPVQWDDTRLAGFTTGTLWIKVNPNYKTINVKQALADPNSIFYYYQHLIQLRKEYPVIVYGTYDLMLADHEQIYAFTRTLGDDRLLVMLNFTKDTPSFTLPSQIHFASTNLLISNYAVDPDEDIRSLTLRPFEARVYRLRQMPRAWGVCTTCVMLR